MFNYLISYFIWFSRLSSTFSSHFDFHVRVRDFDKSHNLKRKCKTISVGAREVFLELIIELELTSDVRRHRLLRRKRPPKITRHQFWQLLFWLIILHPAAHTCMRYSWVMVITEVDGVNTLKVTIFDIQGGGVVRFICLLFCKLVVETNDTHECVMASKQKTIVSIWLCRI